MNRRSFLKGLAGVAAGALILPPTLEENVEAARRYWALGRIPQPERFTIDVDSTLGFKVGDPLVIWTPDGTTTWHTVLEVNHEPSLVLR